MRMYPNFSFGIDHVGKMLQTASHEVKPKRWQSMDVSKLAEATMREILNVSFQVMLTHENPARYAQEIGPNLPWAEDHFLERVGGYPLNPGKEWRNWPWALAADKHRTERAKTAEDAQFSHTYMERYWPKQAGNKNPPHRGIRYQYGDLQDVVTHLLGDPGTRQAYLPVWFPEDTGVVHGERVPCSLGYHWILRNGYLHTVYYIRSCDYYRHFRDDLYLTVRLTLWLLEQLRAKEREEMTANGEAPYIGGFWDNVKPGFLTFHCVSMHLFVNDYIKLFGKTP